MIPFNKPYTTCNEHRYITEVLQNRRFAGDGSFSKKCAHWLESNLNCKKAILVPSGTAALEMMMLLAGIQPGDEVIMPSFTFSSTANAVVLRNATPVFVDIRSDTLNINEDQVEAAITPKTKAICPVYYAGVACDMEKIQDIADRHHLLVLPDAAQAILSRYKGKSLCSFGNMSAVSFHETKNIHCGEGGALLINDPAFVERAEIIMEKGTDRSKFFRGEIDKYTWVDMGSSMLINEMTAAFLWAQLEQADDIASTRMHHWNVYHQAFAPLEQKGLLRRPFIPKECEHNAHIYEVLFHDEQIRNRVMQTLKDHGFGAVFHYVPLDSATAGKKYGRSDPADLPVTEEISGRLLRMPLFYELDESVIPQIVQVLEKCLQPVKCAAN